MYQHTTADQFKQLISNESLNVSKEELVFESVLEWVSYDEESRTEHLPELLAEVQWPLVRNKKVLREALDNPLIAGRPECVQVLNEGNAAVL